jgi:hypothetical protein
VENAEKYVSLHHVCNMCGLLTDPEGRGMLLLSSPMIHRSRLFGSQLNCNDHSLSEVRERQPKNHLCVLEVEVGQAAN